MPHHFCYFYTRVASWMKSLLWIICIRLLRRSNHCSACINFKFLSHNFNFLSHNCDFIPHNFNFLCHNFNIHLIISPLYLKILSFYLIIMSLLSFFLNLVIITYSELFFLNQCKIFLLFFSLLVKRLFHKNVSICN